MRPYNISSKPKVEQSSMQAYDYYEARKTGLGDEFLDELERVKTLIAKHPKIAQITYKNIRQKTLKRFPHSILYTLNEAKKQIKIIALMHDKQRMTIYE